MVETNKPTPGVTIFAPDHSLQAKVGTSILDKILSPEIVKKAEDKIIQSKDNFATESFSHIDELVTFLNGLKNKPENTSQLVEQIIAAAFSLKSKSGIGGYELVSALAKSLHVYCEGLETKEILPRNVEIIGWHIASLQKLAQGKIKGTGGAIGTEIMAEIARLTGQKS